MVTAIPASKAAFHCLYLSPNLTITINEKVFNSDGKLVGVTVLKGNNDPGNSDKDDHEVDAISGSTITGDGVTNMIVERLNNYLPYLEKLNLAQL